MPKKLTLKQRAFVHEYIRTSNATEAADRIYNVKDRTVAASVGCENLRKPYVAEYINQLLESRDGLTLDDALESLSQCLHAPMKPTISAGEKLAAITLLLKLHKAIPGTQPTTTTTTKLTISAQAIADRVAAQEIDITPETPQLNPESD